VLQEAQAERLSVWMSENGDNAWTLVRSGLGAAGWQVGLRKSKMPAKRSRSTAS